MVSFQTRQVASWAAQVFRLSAQCLRTSPTALGAFYHRERSRLGLHKATTTTAHKVARLFYTTFWTRDGEYALSRS
ncbi:MAG: hypothetical protein JOZ78_16665 [Chroococcidiopsidaceae cyanobacterium CP_BM_ER_R8_30]|nr:hypothetical protein [Chroococcidiopsidaceae cyanobacterium CP_BM_ER_R8_30]